MESLCEKEFSNPSSRLNNYLDPYFQMVLRSFDKEPVKGQDSSLFNKQLHQIKTILDKYINSLKVPHLNTEEAQDIMECLKAISSLNKPAHGFDAIQKLYHQVTGIPTIESIKNGDELRNINSYEYLRNFLTVIPTPDTEFKKYFGITSKAITYKYKPNYHYGDLYSAFLLKLEALIRAKHPLATRLMRAVYLNNNLSLERTYRLIAPQLSQNKEHIRDFLKVKEGKPINKICPRDTDSPLTQFENKIYARNVRPQATSNQVALRHYAYKDDTCPIELRMGTQGIFNDFKPEIYPLFTSWLASTRLEKIKHIYFNMLPFDRAEPTGINFFNPFVYNASNEVLLTRQLHKLNEEKLEVAVITLPSGLGLLDKQSKELSYDEALDRILRVVCGTSLEKIKDFHLSPYVKKLVYGGNGKAYDRENETVEMTQLLHHTFKAFGFKAGPISPEDQQSLAFHFFKYEFPNFIIQKLNPQSFNISCFDGIDRAGIASAYYNLMKSIEKRRPLSQADFERALHAAPVMVKERPINNQIELLWRSIDYFINKQSSLNPNLIPNWLRIWHRQNNHHPIKLPEINLKSQEELLIEYQPNNAVILRDIVETLKENITRKEGSRESWFDNNILIKLQTLNDISNSLRQHERSTLDNKTQHEIIGRIQQACNIKRNPWGIFQPHSVNELNLLLKTTPSLTDG